MAASSTKDNNQRRNTILVTEQLASTATALAQAAKLSLHQAHIDATRSALRDLKSAVSSAGDPTSEALHVAARAMTDNLAKLVEASGSVNSNPRDNALQYKLASAAKALPVAIQAVLHSAGGLSVGVKQCDEAIAEVEAALADIDSASIAATFGQLEAGFHKTHSECRQELASLSQDLGAHLRNLSSTNPQEQARAAINIKNCIGPLVAVIKAAAATTTNKDTQQSLLAAAKSLSDCILALLSSVRHSATGSSEAAEEVPYKLSEAEKALDKLVKSATSEPTAVRELESALDTIQNTVRALERAGGTLRAAKSYRHCKTEVKLHCQELVKGLGFLDHLASFFHARF